MGAYLTRNRAWVYIAFYDDYCGRNINMCAGLSVIFAMPLYLYGIHLNRNIEVSMRNYYYNWSHFDKRNRLCHNMIMEHFEVHTEQLQDLLIDLDKEGPAAFRSSVESSKDANKTTTNLDDLALMDELAGLPQFWDRVFDQLNVPVLLRQKMEARLLRYNGAKDKDIAMNELKMKLFGN